jgi:sulfur carrier protein
MMQITVNGKMFETEKKLSVIDLLIEKKVKSPEMVSVELNNKIIHQDDFSNTELKENDRVEFLYFMGGGQRTHGRVTL